MTHDAVQRWLDAYIAAWREYDSEAIAELFAENATYAYQPWATAIEGREAIVAAWLSEQDEPGSWEAEYRPILVDGDSAVVVGDTSYVKAMVELLMLSDAHHEEEIEDGVAEDVLVED